jgi:RNA polymerase sigma factor (sigma-70 family)
MCDDSGSLIEKARQGDIEAQDLLFKRYKDLVHRYAYKLCSADASDVVSAVFWRLFKTESFRYLSEAKFNVWLAMTTRRLCYDQKKSGDAVRTVQMSEKSDTPDPSDPIEEMLDEAAKRARIRKLHQSISQLSEREQDIIAMHYYEGMNLKEIAGVYSKTQEVIKQTLYRIRKKLRLTLGEDFPHFIGEDQDGN